MKLQNKIERRKEKGRGRREKKGRGGEEVGTAGYTGDVLLFMIEDLNFDDLFLGKTYFLIP